MHRPISTSEISLLIFTLIILLLPSGMTSLAGEGGVSPADGEDGDLSLDDTSIRECSTTPGNREDPMTYWPMFGADASHSGLGYSFAEGLDIPYESWDSFNPPTSWGVTIGDFNPNVMVMSGNFNRSSHHVVSMNGTSLEITDGWRGDVAYSLPFVEPSRTCPALADLNGNGKLNVVVGTRSTELTDGTLQALEPTLVWDGVSYQNEWSSLENDTLWNYTAPGDIVRTSPMITPYSLDDDGYRDVIVCFSNESASQIHAVSGKDGSPIWPRPYTLEGYRSSTPVILGSDATSGMIVTTSMSPAVVTGLGIPTRKMYVDAVTTSGEWLWNQTFDVSGLLGGAGVVELLPSPCGGDVTDSPGTEIVIPVPFVGGDGQLLVYDWTGNELAEINLTGELLATPSLADVDSDGLDEVFALTSEFSTRLVVRPATTHLFAMDMDTGGVRWDFAVSNLSHRPAPSPCLSDLNGDGAVDVVFGVINHLYGVDGESGTELWDLSTLRSSLDVGFTDSPALGDVNGDDYTDIAWAGKLVTHRVVDLTMYQEGLVFSKQNITQDVKLRVTARVINLGTAPSGPVDVQFLLDGEDIGNVTMGSGVMPGEVGNATLEWTPEVGGDHQLSVVIDPHNGVVETNEDNNNLTVDVRIWPKLADLTLHDLRFFRGDGKEAKDDEVHLVSQETSTVKVELSNTGESLVPSTLINLTSDGITYRSKQVTNIKPGDTLDIPIPWTAPPGSQDVQVTVDPANSSQEWSEENNQVEATVIVLDNSQPSLHPYPIAGNVLDENGDPVVEIPVTVTNIQTGEMISQDTNSDGGFSLDLMDLPSRYFEGNNITIHARSDDGEREFKQTFRAYSEDGGWSSNMTLATLPKYYFSATLDPVSTAVEPEQTVEITVNVTNDGTEPNRINLSAGSVTTLSGMVLANWSVSVSPTMLSIPVGATRQAVLSISSPTAEEAPAGLETRVNLDMVSLDDPSQRDTLTASLKVSRVHLLELELPTGTIDVPASSESVSFDVPLVLSNQGNGEEGVSLSVDLPASWVVDMPTFGTLQPGEEVNGTLSFQVNDRSASGSHSMTVSVISTQSGKSFNRTLDVNILRPDLYPASSLSLSTENVMPGHEVTVTATILIDGNYTINSVNVELRANGVLVDETVANNVAPDDINDVSLVWIPPVYDVYVLELTVDAKDRIPESDEENNVATETVRAVPDFAFEGGLSYSTQEGTPLDISDVSAGEQVVVTARLKNAGKVDFLGTVLIDVYLDAESSASRLETVSVVDVSIVGARDVTFTWEAQDGDHMFILVADPSNATPEILETNNRLESSKFTVSGDGDEGSGGSTIEENNSWLWIAVVVILIIMAIYYFWSEGRDDREDDEKGPRVDLKKATDRERSEPVDALVVEDHSSDDAVDVVEIRD